MSDPRDIITAAIQAHEDGTMRVVDRTWHAFCDCGTDLGDTMGPLVDSSYDQAGRLHQKHLAEAIRAALAAAGLLVQPGSETRTEWSAEPSLTPRYVTGPIESDREIVCPMREPEQAMRDYLRGMRGRPVLVRRTVYTGPWQPATQEAPHA